MSVRRVKAGTTDVSITLKIIDSTDGTPETSVVFNTSGIDLWYRRDGAASVDITEATLSALTDAHSDGGFLHINDGVYRLDLPDAACASGVAGVQIGGTVTGMVVLAPYIELPVNTDEDVYTRVGAPAGASVSADILAIDNLVDDLESRVGTPSNLGGGATLSANLADIEAQTDDIGAAGAGLTALASAANLATVAGYLDTEIAAILADTNELQTDWANGGRLDLLIDAIKASTDVLIPNANGPWPALGVIDIGTAQSATGTTLVLRSGITVTDDVIIGATLWVYSSTNGLHERRIITDWVSATDTAAVDAWTQTPTGTILYVLLATPPASTGAPIAVNVTQIEGVDATDQLDAHAAAGLDAAGVRAAIGLASANLDTQLGAIDDFLDTEITDIRNRLPAALVSGRMDASVGAMAANVMTAAAAAADLTTELQSGLATASALSTLDGKIDTIDGIVDDLKSGIIYGAAATGTLSTTQATTNLTGYADDQLIGRVIIWLTGACEGEASDITDYANASGLLTFTALTTAPGNGDTFKIV